MRRGCVALAVVLAAVGPTRASAQPEPDIRLSVEVADVDAAKGRLGDDVVFTIPALDTVVVEVPASQVAATAAGLRASGAGRIEVDPEVHADALIPDDPYFSDSWGLRKVNAPAAWGRTTGSASTVVAVLDTGIDASKPDLEGAVVDGIDLQNGDDDPTDDHGHGTSVAAILAARGDNGVGVAGYCWSCSLLAVKVLDAEGSGDSSTVASGMVWAVDAGASIINLSLSSVSSSFPLSSAVEYARERGVIVVAAGGNDGLVQPTYPAAYPGVVGVVAMDEDDRLYSWSNRGSWASIAAPGCHLTITDDGYGELCGTSAAAPAVAGVLALEQSVAPDASAERIVDVLLGAASRTPDLGPHRLSASGAVGAALRSDPSDEDDSGQEPSAGAPGRPRGVRVHVSDGVAALSWAPPEDAGTAPVDAYVVTATPGGLIVEVSADTTETTVPGLQSGVSYRFVVTARNEHGLGAASDPTSPVTLAAEGVARVAGAGRVLTAVALSQRAFTDARVVVIARADDFADALAAAPLAARFGGPLLLTSSRTAAIEPEVGAELRRLGAEVAHIVGGIGAPDSELVRSLSAYGVTHVVRTTGVDRFDTARLVASQVGGTAVYIANGDTGWPDAVAASALAAVQGRPILLVTADGVPEATRDALVELGASAAVVIGGSGSVPNSLFAVLADPEDDGHKGVAVSRVAGTDRYDTSRRVADLAVAAGADPSRAWLASGQGWPDALAAGPAVAARGGVLLLIRGDDLNRSPGAAAWLSEHAATLDEIVLVGGGASIDQYAEDQLRGRLAGR